jgi:hypothetical protein
MLRGMFTLSSGTYQTVVNEEQLVRIFTSQSLQKAFQSSNCAFKI